MPNPPSRTAGRRHVLIGSVALVLLVAIGFVVIGALLQPERTFNVKLDDLLASEREAAGWTLTRRPIAATVEMNKAVAELLNYDDGVYAIYNGNDIRISIYAAYWSPGKMSHRLIATHTPDVCWVGGGWQSLSRDAQVISGKGGAAAFPMERRTFQLKGQTEHVVFCHLVGDGAMSYQTVNVPPWHASISDVFARGFRQRDEQLFLRVSSNRPVEEFKDAVPVQIFLDRLARAMPKMVN